jgi:hypothetical protein
LIPPVPVREPALDERRVTLDDFRQSRPALRFLADRKFAPVSEIVTSLSEIKNGEELWMSTFDSSMWIVELEIEIFELRDVPETSREPIPEPRELVPH